MLFTTGIATTTGTLSQIRCAGCPLYTPGPISPCQLREFKVIVTVLIIDKYYVFNSTCKIVYFNIHSSDFSTSNVLLCYFQIYLGNKCLETKMLVMKKWRQMPLKKVKGYVHEWQLSSSCHTIIIDLYGI